MLGLWQQDLVFFSRMYISSIIQTISFTTSVLSIVSFCFLCFEVDELIFFSFSILQDRLPLPVI